MSTATNNIKKGINYTTYNPGSMAKWKDYDVEFPGLKIEGKHFLKEFLGFTGCEISIDSMAPGANMPFYHKHTMNEEAYIFLKGKGRCRLMVKLLMSVKALLYEFHLTGNVPGAIIQMSR